MPCFYLIMNISAMTKQYDILVKLMILGDSGVGKTCLLRRFTEKEYHPYHISTIGVDFKMKTLDIDGVKVRVQIWDTAGQERYQSITKQYYRRAQGIILVYDITNEPSFHHIMSWAGDVDENAPDHIQRILVGNKSDMEAQRCVSEEKGKELAAFYGLDFFETSACTNQNISEPFTRLTKLVLQAHSRHVDRVLEPLDRFLDGASLEEEKGPQAIHENTQDTCSC
ncbi:ras-related protein Rab-15 [Gadus morhua]|uniref:small monomeric GTPase n=1 Tax=Gadus morhua TaxID=8049 RepID=A0A8C4ZMY4_GADMO|nr:ras-related protein Rab-15-like [Gadus morhua]